MRYVSTRGLSPAVSAAEAIVRGIAPDGGLYMPESIPAFTKEELSRLPGLSYRETANLVLAKYLTDLPASELDAAVQSAYARFPGDSPAPIVTLGEGRYILELWHGPTAAFKDMALQLFPRLLPLCKEKCGDTGETRILTATSGDTGKAALEGFKDVPGTSVAVFYPYGGVSRIQALQMQTQTGENVAVYAIRGDFDDAQTGVKALFADEALRAALGKKSIRLSSANSINFGRLLPQIVYYVYASSQLPGETPADFIVPTGNFGNILAGFMAKRMGAKVGSLVSASNENKVLADFFATGVYDRRRTLVKTSSPSMDILVSSNLERLLLLKSGDPGLVRKMMESLADTGVYRLPKKLFDEIGKDFLGGWADDAEAKAAVHRLREAHGYLADPHTAVADAVYEKLKTRLGGKTVTVSTASPYKFAPAVLEGISGEKADGFDAMDRLHALTGVPVPEALSALRTAEVRFDKVIDVKEMREAAEFLFERD